jgi:hypothetical protein
MWSRKTHLFTKCTPVRFRLNINNFGVDFGFGVDSQGSLDPYYTGCHIIRKSGARAHMSSLSVAARDMHKRPFAIRRHTHAAYT